MNLSEKTRTGIKIIQNEGQPPTLEWSWAVKTTAGIVLAGFLSSLAVVLLGYPSLADDVKEQEQKVKVLEKNQRKIDETVRNVQADTRWTNAKLDAMLMEMGITKRITRPEVEDSKLEDSDE